MRLTGSPFWGFLVVLSPFWGLGMLSYIILKWDVIYRRVCRRALSLLIFKFCQFFTLTPLSPHRRQDGLSKTGPTRRGECRPYHAWWAQYGRHFSLNHDTSRYGGWWPSTLRSINKGSDVYKQIQKIEHPYQIACLRSDR